MKESAKKKGKPRQETSFPDKLAKPALRALHAAGYTTLKQLTEVSEKELLQLHGVGQDAITKIKKALSAEGLSLTKGDR